MLKDGRYTKCAKPKGKDADLTNKVCTGSSASYLCLVIDIPPDRDHAERYRIVLTRLLSAIKLTDPNAVIMPYEAEPECSNNKNHYLKKSCVDQPGNIPRSITQLQKFFTRGKPKKGGGTVHTSLFLLHDEVIADMIIDMKDGMEAFNPKISMQRIQHHDATKLGYAMCLTTKIEMSR